MDMTDKDRYLAISEALKRRSQRLLSDPELLKAWIQKMRGSQFRELDGKEATNMQLILKMVGHYTYSNNQRTHTYHYRYNDREYRITYGLGDDPMIEEEVLES